MLVSWKPGHHQLPVPEISLIQPSLPHPVAPPRPSRCERTTGRWTKPPRSTSFGLRDRSGKQKTYCLCLPAPSQVRHNELEVQHPLKAQTPPRVLSRKTQPTALAFLPAGCATKGHWKQSKELEEELVLAW